MWQAPLITHGSRAYLKFKVLDSPCHGRDAPETPTPIESNLQRSPAHAPHIRGVKSHGRNAPVTPTPFESNLRRSPAHAPHIRGLKV